MAFIYGIRDTNSSTYFYIGSTKRTIAERWKQHKADVHTGRHTNRHFANKVRKIGLDHIAVDLLEECDDALQFSCEAWWIQKYLDGGVKLTNLIGNGHQFASMARKYSLSSNWAFIKVWYDDYSRGILWEADRPDFQDKLDQVQHKLASIVAPIINAPLEQQPVLLEQFE